MSLSHMVLSCKANWSHLRSLCILAARIARSRAVDVTILVASVDNIVDRVSQEVSRCMDVEENTHFSKIRVAGLSAEGGSNVLDDSFRHVWRALMNAEPIRCSYTMKALEAVSIPSVVVLDGFQLSWLEIIRAESLHPPIFQWMMAFSAGFVYMCGPENMGGRSGRPVNHGAHDCKDLIRISGMPSMTCSDLHPQDVGDKAAKIQIAEATMTEFSQRADGLLTTCAPEYDGVECLDAISDWIAGQQGRMTFHLGPMLPLIPGTRTFSAKAMGVEINTSPNGSGFAVMQFLNDCLALHGKHSVFYISFGTEHWPSSLDHLEVLLDTMISLRHPFILAHAYSNAKSISKLKNKYSGKGKGIILPFVPQQGVLAHEACGWFITHGGANGVIEALTQGIPMIGWPFAVDQPLNVAYMARTLDVGFELKKMRSELCLSKTGGSKRNLTDMGAWEIEVQDVLHASVTAIGQRKRANAVRIGENLALAWSEPNGRARLQLSRFLDALNI